MSQQVNDMIAALDGLQLPGGCGHCNAYQELQARAYGQQNIHVIHVYHDDWCPAFGSEEPHEPPH